MKKDNSFHEYVMRDFLGDISGITSRAMFGGWGVYKDGTIFGIIFDGELYFKVDKSNFKIQKEFCSFDTYIWKFVGGKPIINRWENLSDMPARTELSDKISKDLKKRGMTFVGSTIIYAIMQTIGMVNDHKVGCFRHNKLRI